MIRATTFGQHEGSYAPAPNLKVQLEGRPCANTAERRNLRLARQAAVQDAPDTAERSTDTNVAVEKRGLQSRAKGLLPVPDGTFRVAKKPICAANG